MWNLDVLLTGGVSAAVVASIFELFHILLNKKVRTPADVASQRRADIVERNEMLAEQRTEVKDLREQVGVLRGEINTLRITSSKREEELEEEIDGLREQALARDHYIYRCLGTFHRLGMEEHIPKPTPFEKERELKKETNNE